MLRIAQPLWRCSAVGWRQRAFQSVPRLIAPAAVKGGTRPRLSTADLRGARVCLRAILSPLSPFCLSFSNRPRVASRGWLAPVTLASDDRRPLHALFSRLFFSTLRTMVVWSRTLASRAHDSSRFSFASALGAVQTDSCLHIAETRGLEKRRGWEREASRDKGSAWNAERASNCRGARQPESYCCAQNGARRGQLRGRDVSGLAGRTEVARRRRARRRPSSVRCHVAPAASAEGQVRAQRRSRKKKEKEGAAAGKTELGESEGGRVRARERALQSLWGASR